MGLAPLSDIASLTNAVVYSSQSFIIPWFCRFWVLFVSLLLLGELPCAISDNCHNVFARFG